MALTFIPANAQHIGTRQEQQDSFGFSDPDDREFVDHAGLLAVVADGMGGLAGGAAASHTAVQTFHSVYRTKDRAETIQAALRRCLAEANRAVSMAADPAGRENSGTTIAAAVLHQSCLHWIAVGDTRIYILRAGQIARVNVDHNYRTTLWPEIAAGRAARESAWNDPRATHLTSYLGMPETPGADVSTRPFPLAPGDIMIVCTDGVYRALDEHEIAATFSRLPPDAACESVEAATLSKGFSQQDNLTVISIQCRNAALPSPPSAGGARGGKMLLAAALCVETALAAGLTARLIRPHWRFVTQGPARQKPTPIAPKTPPKPPEKALAKPAEADQKKADKAGEDSQAQIPEQREAK